MTEEIVYKITVYATENYLKLKYNASKDIYNFKDNTRYPVKFTIVKIGKESLYQLRCHLNKTFLNGGFFISELDTKNALLSAMKLAMKGEYIYALCYLCLEKNYYPNCKKCKKCGMKLPFALEMLFTTEIKNEKKIHGF